MATSSLPRAASRGGSFLVESCTPEDVFSPAELTDDQKLIGQTAEEFVRNEVVPAIPDLEQHKPGLLPQLLKKAGEIGLLGGGVPDEYGGAGLDKVSSVQLAEKLSAYASFGVSHGGHSGIGTLPIVFFGTDEQKKKYLPVLATGEKLAAYCLSEPQAGSDAQNSRTRAVLSPDGRSWILNGQKMWITNGGFADVYIVFAKVDGEKFSCFIVERGFPGFLRGRGRKKDGPEGQLDDGHLFRELPGAQGKSAARNRPRAHRGLQYFERRKVQPGRVLHRRLQGHARNRVEVRERARRLRQADRQISA